MEHQRRWTYGLFFVLLWLGGMVVIPILTASASPTGGTFIVTRLDDPAPDGCQPTDCSLREAVAAANGAGGGTITFQVNGTVALVSGQLTVTGTVTVAGNSAISNTIASNGAARIFNADGVSATACALHIHNVTLTGGMSDGQGGAILATDDCAVMLSSVVVIDNRATFGGGVAKVGFTEGLTIQNSAIISNSATNGGGVAVLNGSAVLNNVTVSGNEAESRGGGLYIQTIDDNAILLQSVTIADNSAATADGIAFEETIPPQNGFVRLFNTIIADTGSSACATIGFNTLSFQSIGFNLATDSSCQLTGLADMPDQEPQLGELVLDSGTYVHVPALTSPVMDSGAAGALTTDQRGLTRPVDLPEFPNANDGADRGAYEHQSDAPTAVAIADFDVGMFVAGKWIFLLTLFGMAGLVWHRRKGSLKNEKRENSRT
jgi:CSLREA domain-containing protein